VVFPIMVLMVVQHEPWLEISVTHLVQILLAIVAGHLWLRWWYGQRVHEVRAGSDFEDSEELFQQLGLRD
jgi:hypothetical protein